MAREFVVGIPTFSTKQRMKEVQFYLIVKQLRKKYKENIYLDNIIENLTQLFGAKISLINYALDNLDTIQFKPTPLELILCAKYMGIKMRTVCGVVGKASRTLYNALEKYIKEGHYPLNPVLSENIIADVEKFNRGMKDVFGDITQIIDTSVADATGKKTEYIYDCD